MPKETPKKENGGGLVPMRPSAQNGSSAMSKLKQSGVKLLQKTAQRLNMREEAGLNTSALVPDSDGHATEDNSTDRDQSNESVFSGSNNNGSHAPETPSGIKESNAPLELSKTGKHQDTKRASRPHFETKRHVDRRTGSAGKPHSKKSGTHLHEMKKSSGLHQAESKASTPQLDQKRGARSHIRSRPASSDAGSPGPSRQPSTDGRQPSAERGANAPTSTSTAPITGLSRPARPSNVRHRDRAKVSFSTNVEMLGPPLAEVPTPAVADNEAAAAAVAAAAAASSAAIQEEEETAASQAENLRKLEKENECLRNAIENYRELERRRAASTSDSKSPSEAGGTSDQEETPSNEDGEEDEIEKAIEVSPDGTFLKFSEEIGRGSFKTVYKGLDTTTGVFVAWCELQVMGVRLSRKERDRFREEADLMKGLTHPNIVRFYDYWEVDRHKKSCIVLVTELMTSGTLRTYLKNFGQKKVSLKIIKQWCRQILRGLQFLHSRNPPIIHRDLKCDNIFISGTTGQVKVGDLGLATLKNRSFAKSVIGTPEFMAPEVYEEHYDEAVDVYAFGMCMLEMVTAEYPYSECSGPAQIYKKVVAGIKPSSLEKVEDPEVRELMDWCTRLDNQQRPTVKQLLAHQFFAEDCGMRLDIANREETVGSATNVVELQLRVLDAKKRRDHHKENEAIQFNYVLNKDNPEETAKQMVMSGLLAEENWRPVAKMIVNQIQSLVRAREEKRREQQQGVPAQTQSVPVAAAAAPQPAPAHASASMPTLTPAQAAAQPAPPAAAASHTAAQPTPVPAAAAAATATTAAAATAAAVTQQQPAAHTQSLQQLSGAETAPAVGAATAASVPAAEERGAEPAPTQPQLTVPGTAGPAEAPVDGAVSSESDVGLGEKKEKRNRSRRRKTCERLPRLTVLEVKTREHGPVVSCLLETNQSQAITFKFDLREADVSAISHKMTELHLLPHDDAQYFEEQLQSVICQQLQTDGQLPATALGGQFDASVAVSGVPSDAESAAVRPADADVPTTAGETAPQGRRQSRFVVSSVVESRPQQPSPAHSPAAREAAVLLTPSVPLLTTVPSTPETAVVSSSQTPQQPQQPSNFQTPIPASNADTPQQNTPQNQYQTPVQNQYQYTTPVQNGRMQEAHMVAGGSAVQPPTPGVSSTTTQSHSPVFSPVAEPSGPFLSQAGAKAPPSPAADVAVFKTPAARPPKMFKVTPASSAVPSPFATPVTSPDTPTALNDVTGPRLPRQPQAVVSDNGSQFTRAPHLQANSVAATAGEFSGTTPQPPSAADSQYRKEATPGDPRAASGAPLSTQRQGPASLPPQFEAPAQQTATGPPSLDTRYATEARDARSAVAPSSQAAAQLAVPHQNVPSSVPSSGGVAASSAAVSSGIGVSANVSQLSPASNSAHGPRPTVAGEPVTVLHPSSNSAHGQRQAVAGEPFTAVYPPASSADAAAGAKGPEMHVSPPLMGHTPEGSGALPAAGSGAVHPAAREALPSPAADAQRKHLDAAAAPQPGLASSATAQSHAAVADAAASPSAPVPAEVAAATISAQWCSSSAEEGRPGVIPVTPSRSLTSVAPSQPEPGPAPHKPPPAAAEPQSSVGNLAQLAEQLTKLTSQPKEVTTVAPPQTTAAADGTTADRVHRMTAGAANPATATSGAPLRASDGSATPAVRPSPETSISGPHVTTDVSRPTSATDTPSGGGRKPPPLLLSDLAKELSKIHGKSHLPHVMSTPMISAMDDTADVTCPLTSLSETVGAPEHPRPPLLLPPTNLRSPSATLTALHELPPVTHQPQPAAESVGTQTDADQAQSAADTGQSAADTGHSATVVPPPGAAPTSLPAVTSPPPVHPGSVVRRGRFAISRARSAETGATDPQRSAAPAPVPAPAPAVAADTSRDGAAIAADASRDGAAIADRPVPAAAEEPQPSGDVEQMGQYKELIARQRAELADFQRRQEAEREALRRQLQQPNPHLASGRRRPGDGTAQPP